MRNNRSLLIVFLLCLAPATWACFCVTFNSLCDHFSYQDRPYEVVVTDKYNEDSTISVRVLESFKEEADVLTLHTVPEKYMTSCGPISVHVGQFEVGDTVLLAAKQYDDLAGSSYDYIPSAACGMAYSVLDNGYYLGSIFRGISTMEHTRDEALTGLRTCVTPTSTGSGSLSVEDVTLSPNPANSVLVLSARVNYQVTDCKGVLLFSGNGNSIDVSDLIEGVYFVKINLEDQTLTKRFIKE